MTLTAITVADGRVRHTHGLLRAQRMADRDGWIRLGVLATTALLLAGDAVELEVDVGPGQRLDLFDVAGTVAYAGRGQSASWHVRVKVGAEAQFRYPGEPFVVADGADVARTLELDVDRGGRAGISESLVLGRSGERGGRLRSRTRITVDGRLVVREDQVLDPDGIRGHPGLLGSARIIDSTINVGDQLLADPPSATGFALLDGAGTLARILR